MTVTTARQPPEPGGSSIIMVVVRSLSLPTVNEEVWVRSEWRRDKTQEIDVPNIVVQGMRDRGPIQTGYRLTGY